jgi:hypothetical protein
MVDNNGFGSGDGGLGRIGHQDGMIPLYAYQSFFPSNLLFVSPELDPIRANLNVPARHAGIALRATLPSCQDLILASPREG